jgi:hydroxycarboxylate dehydrogenase B
MAEPRRCPPRALEEFATGIFEAMGADREVAVEVAHHLVQASLSGHDSHGVLRIPQYVSQADQGLLIPAARPTFLRETGVTALIDACRGFGHFSTAFALDWAVRQARQHGLAAAAVRHSTHIGRLGEYTERAASQGLIALVTVGVAGPGVGGMVLPGSRSRFFGANPWSIGVPALDRPPMIFDGSTSMIAEGKVRFARAQGSPLPPGCIQDKEGNPTTDPQAFYAGGALLPLGGAIAGHKGYSLALASALMGGLAQIDDAEPTLAGASVLEGVEDSRGRVAGVFLAVISPGSFGDAESYQSMVAETLAAAQRMPAAPGSNGVLLPGEPERRARRQREHEGIALPEPIWQELAGVAKRFDVLLPASL